MGIFAGDFRKEYRTALRFADTIYGIETEKVDITVSLTPGVKGWGGGTYLSGAFLGSDIVGTNAIKKDGIVIQVVSAEEGYSGPGPHQVYTPTNMTLSSEEMTWKLTKGDCDLRDMSLRWQVKKCLEETKVHLVSNIREQDALGTRFAAVFRTINKALARALEEKGRDVDIAVIDRAGRPNYMLPH